MIISDLYHLEVVSEESILGGATPPSGVTRTVGSNGNIVVKNGTKTEQGVKIIWAFGDDSACTLIAPKKEKEFVKPDGYGWLEARFDGWKSC
jgi:hypothetical protein